MRILRSLRRLLSSRARIMSAPIMSAETIEQFAKSADRLKEAIVLLKLALAHGRDPSLEMSELDLWLKSFFYDLASASIAAAKREAATGRHMIVHSEADGDNWRGK